MVDTPMVDILVATAKATRKATIEECAKVADLAGSGYLDGNAIAAAIRALKDKP